MGALSFNYSTFPDQNTSAKFFEYRWSIPLAKYNFKYKRYAALSNASIFNSPVAATKVATGVCLYDLFVDKKEKDTTYFQTKSNDSIFLDNIKYPNTDEKIFSHRIINPALWHSDIINKYYESNIKYTQELFEIYKDKGLPIEFPMEIASARFSNIVYENNGHFVLPSTWIRDVIEFITEIVPYNKKYTNVLPRDVINRPHSIKIPYSELITINRPKTFFSTEIHLTYRINRVDAGWTIFTDERNVTVKGNIFNIFKDNGPISYCDYKKNNINDSIVFCRDLYKVKIYENIFGERSVHEILPLIIDFASRSTYIMNVASLLMQAEYDKKEISLDFSFVGTEALCILLNIIDSNSINKFNNVLNLVSNDFSDKPGNNENIFPSCLNISQDTTILNIIEQIDIFREKLYASVRKSDIFMSRFYSYSLFGQVYSTHGDFNIIFDPFNNLASFEDRILDYFQKYDISINAPDKNITFNSLASGVINKNVTYGESVSGTLNKEFTYDNFISIGPPFKMVNDNNDFSAHRPIPNDKSSLSWYENIIVSPSEKDTYKYQGYLLKPFQKIVCELSLADFSITEPRYTLVFDNIFVSDAYKILNSPYVVWGKKYDKISNDFYTAWGKAHNEISSNEEGNLKIGIQKQNPQTNYLTLEENSGTKISNMTIRSMLFANDTGKKFNINELCLVKMGDKSLDDLPPIVTARKDKNGTMVYLNVLINKKIIDTQLFNRKIVRISTIRKGIDIYNHIIQIEKSKINLIIWPDYNPIEKVSYRFDPYKDNSTITKVSYPFVIQDTNDVAHKTKNGFTIYNNNLVDKMRHGFTIYDDNYVYKISKEINMIAIAWLTYKASYDVKVVNYGDHVLKKHQNMFSSTKDFAERKYYEVLSSKSIEGAIRTIYPVAVSHYLKYPNWKEYDGFIVPISRVRYQSIIDYINDFAKKRYRDVMITEEDFGSVLSRPAMLNFDINLDKLPKQVFLDYMNEMLVKTNLKAFIEDGAYGFKEKHNINLQYDEPWGYLNPEHLRIKHEIFGYKSSAKLFLHTDEQLKLSPDGLTVKKDIFTFKVKSKGRLFADEWLDKLPLICYYSYDTWGKGKKDKLFEESHTQVFNPNNSQEIYTDGYFAKKALKKHMMLRFGNFASRDINEFWFEEGVFSNRLVQSSTIFKQMDAVLRGTRELDIYPNDFGNWAWVYETPDPFQYDKYGIDELLLPEKDTQYEDFEDLIFDREHMRPRNPLKEIDETTWIAKLPIRHPVGKYEDVGKVYEDSAVDWENYFGIQSSVIHDMSLRYYRIWEKNMFKFSTMTMQQAANLMLEYLWSWIPDYYPLDQLEQAYRVFRLIRWYTECAVINNSQYIISYEYANLTWPDAEHKGICHIPSDLQEYDPANVMENSNDTMYSDITPGHLCLRNNPIYTGSNDIWVTFKIKNKRNTTISFNMYNESGSVNIYLNDKLIDVISAHGSQRPIYDIRYTGDTNEFKIEKKAADNLDNKFIIGYISIVNQAFKDLTINFDPVHRAGNQPLNEVAQKLILYAALHDRKDIAYYEMLTKNLSISEVYKMLLKYWQLHHENKWKGKRLTIKQV